MVSIDTLVKIYKNFGERQHLSPLLSKIIANQRED